MVTKITETTGNLLSTSLKKRSLNPGVERRVAKALKKDRNSNISARSLEKRVSKTLVKASQVNIKKMASRQFEGWRILLDGKSCGQVKFSPKVDEVFKQHVTVDFAIPQPKRGMHIGRFGLKLAVASSAYKLFVAHLRKNNIASKKALDAVGFLETKYPGSNQLCMVYRK